MFKIYGSRRGKLEQLGDASYYTEKQAVDAALALIGHYDTLEVRDHNDATVWENTNARNAPLTEDK